MGEESKNEKNEPLFPPLPPPSPQKSHRSLSENLREVSFSKLVLTDSSDSFQLLLSRDSQELLLAKLRLEAGRLDPIATREVMLDRVGHLPQLTPQHRSKFAP